MGHEEIADWILAEGFLSPAELLESAPAAGGLELPERYEVLERVGGGAFGEVFRVRDRNMGRVVALKRLRPHPDPRRAAHVRARFRIELDALMRLRHVGIPAIYDAGGGEDGSVYVVMELVEGVPFSEILAAGSATLEERVRVVERAARIVDFAHERGFVHRDLKPDNILVDRRGDAHVVDFGLARDVLSDAAVTLAGTVLGTPYYMSPEQARGESHRVDARSDVFSLGAVLYHAVAGRPPFEGERLLDLVAAVTEKEPRAPRSLDPTIPEALESVVMRALEKDPGRRHASARALADDLHAALERQLARARGRRRATAAVAVGVVVVGGLLGFLAPSSRPAAVAATAPHADPTGSAPARTFLDRAVARWNRYRLDLVHEPRDVVREKLRPAAVDLEQARASGDPRESAVAAWLLTVVSLPDEPRDEELSRRVAALAPWDATLLGILGDLLLSRGKADEARRAFDGALALRPSDPAALAGKSLAVAAARASDDSSRRRALDEASRLAEEALAVDPGSGDGAFALYEARAWGRESMGQRLDLEVVRKLHGALEKARAANARDVACRVVLGEVCLDLFRATAEHGAPEAELAQEAWDACRGLSETDPCGLDGMKTAARAALILHYTTGVGALEEASADLERLATLLPEDAWVQVDLADVQRARGFRDDAVKALKRAEKLDPALAEVVASRLQRLE